MEAESDGVSAISLLGFKELYPEQFAIAIVSNVGCYSAKNP